MQVGPTRRAMLALAAGLLARPAIALTAGPSQRVLRAIATVKTGNEVLTPPAYGDGRVVFSGDRMAGAIDSASGAILWRIEIPHGMAARFRPRLGGGLAVITGRTGIAVHDAASGEPLWRRVASIQIGTPLLSGDAIYFGDGHEIVAVDARFGAERWRHAGVPDTLAAYAPAISGDTVMAGPGDGRLYALSAADGRERWQRNRSDEWQYLRQLHVHDGILVAGSYKEKLFGIAVSDGQALWTFNAGNFINSHHVAGGVAYLWSPTGHVHAIDATSGKALWRHETTDYDGTAGNWSSVLAELVVSEGRLLALDMADVLHVLAADNGEEQARYTVGVPIRHAVLPVPGGRFVFPTTGGELLIAEPA